MKNYDNEPHDTSDASCCWDVIVIQNCDTDFIWRHDRTTSKDNCRKIMFIKASKQKAAYGSKYCEEELKDG
jgi:hypothetical protein